MLDLSIRMCMVPWRKKRNRRKLYAGHVSQAEPNNGRLEVDLEGVSLQLDTFKPEGSPYAWRLAFSIHQLEVCCSSVSSASSKNTTEGYMHGNLKPKPLTLNLECLHCTTDYETVRRCMLASLQATMQQAFRFLWSAHPQFKPSALTLHRCIFTQTLT